MLFNSYIFILCFFPLALAAYFILNHFNRYTLAKCVLIGFSLYFYAYFNLNYLFILVGSILINFLLSKLISRNPSKILLGLGVFLNIGVIFYYKYFDFFVSSINTFFKTDIPLLRVLMPLGISFFTFQQVSYLVDSYRGETKEYSFVDYALFVSFFPQLIAGPIVLHEEMIPQLRDESKKHFCPENLSKGLFVFSTGLAKKVLLADLLAGAVDTGYGMLENLGGLDVLILAVFYSFQLYFDFSGYCDMAYGIATCFNIELPINFNSPYKAVSIADFWKRWHITLNRFLTRYVYYPLGGNRKGITKTCINILLVFLVSGLWHGAAWTFVLWGCIHGLASVLYRLGRKAFDRLWVPFRVFVNFLFVTAAWIFFRAENLHKAFLAFRKLAAEFSFRLNREFMLSFKSFEIEYVEEHVGFLRHFINVHPEMHMLLFGVIAIFIVFFTKNVYEKEFKTNLKTAVLSVVFMAWSIISLSGVSVFLYFNF